jgi:PAS domain S-box-containing protein
MRFGHLNGFETIMNSISTFTKPARTGDRRYDHARILVVDDNTAVLDDFRKVLSSSNASPDAELLALENSLFARDAGNARADEVDRPSFQLDLIQDGAIACQSVARATSENRPFALAFVDMRMPGGWDGLRTIEELWRVDPDIQIVICTAYADHSWDEIVNRLGCTDRLLILRKPFESIEVFQLACALFDKWCLQRSRQLQIHELEERVAERTRELSASNAELRDSEKRYRMLFESNPLPMWTYDLDTLRFLNVNDVACAKYGYSREEFLAMTLRDIRPAEDIQDMEASVRDTQPTVFSSGLWRHRRKDGTLIDVEIASHPMSLDGRRMRFVCPLDVTQRLSAERALREAETRFRALVEQSITGIYILEKGAITYANAKLCEIVGYELEELRAMDISTLVLEEDRERILEALRRRAEGEVGSNTLECRIRHKLGHDVPIAVESKVIHIAGNGVVVGVVRDVTPRMRALEALRESERRFRELAENIHEVFFLTDPASDRILYISPAYETVWGRSCDELYADSTSWLASVHADDLPKVLASLRERETTGRFDLEYRISRTDGAIRWIRSRGFPIRDEQGKICRIAGVAEDITERKDAEEEVHRLTDGLERRVVERTAALEAANQQLEALNHELEAFSYTVSHDLRGPLRTIEGFGDALYEEYGARLDPEAGRYLSRIRAGALRMSELIDDLLNLATVSRASLKMGEFDLGDVAQEVVDELRQRDATREVRVAISSGMHVHADRRLLRVVMENLIGNAWKYTSARPGASIELGCLEGAAPIYFVRDNGAGFDMEFAHKLFVPFERLHSAEQFSGTGIGLATVKRIMDRHGARVWAESKVGEGSTFYFSLGSGL